MPVYAEVAVLPPNFTPPHARARPVYHYAIPPELAGVLSPGHFVLVPFGRHVSGKTRLVSGVVFKISEVSETSEVYTGQIKPIRDLLDPQPLVSETHLHLARWMSDYYLAPLCECLRLFAPPGQAIHSDLEYALVTPSPQPPSTHPSPGSPPKTARGTAPRLGSLQAAIVATLEQRGPLRAGQLSAALRHKNWETSVKSLIARGIVTARRVLPLPRTRPKLVRFVELTAAPSSISDTDLGRKPGTIQRRRRALQFLQREGRPVEIEWVYAESGCKAADLNFLEKKRLLKTRPQEVLRDPLAGKEFVPLDSPSLTSDQAAAWQRIKSGLNQAFLQSPSLPISQSPDLPISQFPAAYLLHGVTGSGKTEIYLRAVAETLRADRQAIVLVPEISLTPQTIRRFVARFPGRVAAWHSQLSLDERYDTWRRIRAGEADVVVGPRSALFSPLERLGLIVIDEEHESSYKQSVESDLPFDSPPYHARQAALELARLTGSIVILGSATPSLEAYARAQRGELTLLELPKRILSHAEHLRQSQARHRLDVHDVETRYRPLPGAPEARFIKLPPVQSVDMRRELRAGNRHIFSRALQAALAETLQKRQQAILFLNRRGSATFVLCRDCGHVMKCPRCDLPLTHHEISDFRSFGPASAGRREPQDKSRASDLESQPNAQRLTCHQCNHHEPTPQTCPGCDSPRIRYFGLGTQRVEKAVAELFPQARVLRWDADTAMGKGTHELFLQQFVEGRMDVMVGTQMIAKGLDLPFVTLVGVISADTSLHLPHFRAAERTFQLLAQVAGRAGRGLMGGRVIVQSYSPEHYAIQAATRHDYAAFLGKELAFRRQLDYPPFTRLARLLLCHTNPLRARDEAEYMAAALSPRLEAHDLDSDALIGPAPCFLPRIRDQYRWQIILRAPDPAAVLRNVPLSPAWRVDVDPVDLL